MSKTRGLFYLFIALLLGVLVWLTLKQPNPWGISQRHPVFLVVDKSEFKLYFLEQGTIKKTFPVVLGRPRTKTPPGKWRVAKKRRFNKLGIYGFYKMQLDRLVDERYEPTIYAIHGTNHEELLKEMPRMFSNGCVRLYNRDIAYLWQKVPPGTPVQVIP